MQLDKYHNRFPPLILGVVVAVSVSQAYAMKDVNPQPTSIIAASGEVLSSLFEGLTPEHNVKAPAKTQRPRPVNRSCGPAPPLFESGDQLVTDIARGLEGSYCFGLTTCEGQYYMAEAAPEGSCVSECPAQVWDSWIDIYVGGCDIGTYNFYVCDPICCISNPDCVNESLDVCDERKYFWDTETCRCVPFSPIIIDVRGNGYALTSASEGVDFDFSGTGEPIRASWTTANSDDGFLVLDRNGDGLVSTGSELFGNYTPQPATEYPNGFLALAEYDKPENGGKQDGTIDTHDSIFESLRVWVDSNHNGISEADELFTLEEMTIVSISLDFKESSRRDRFGNHFMYRSKVKQGAETERWAYDVALVTDKQ